MKLASLVLALLVLGGMSLATALPASACSCESSSDAQAFDRAGAVFVGELAAYTPASPVSGAACGLEMPHIGRFLVFAGSGPSFVPGPVPGEVLSSHLCDIKRGAHVGKSS